MAGAHVDVCLDCRVDGCCDFGGVCYAEVEVLTDRTEMAHTFVHGLEVGVVILELLQGWIKVFGSKRSRR